MPIKYNRNKIIKKHKYTCSMIVWLGNIKQRLDKTVLINVTLWPGEWVYNQRETTLIY